MFKSTMLKNEKGFTLIEMMIAAFIGLMVLGGSIYVFNKQNTLIRTENARTDVRALGRFAMAELATEIRRAGYGFPNAWGIFVAEPDQLTFFANTFDTNGGLIGVQEAYTTGTADITAGDTNISVADNSDFSNGNFIVVFDASGTVAFPWAGGTVTGTPGATITLSSASPAAFALLDGIVVNQYQAITYDFDAVNGLLTVSTNPGGGAGVIPVIGNVTALSFTYFDVNGTQIIPATPPALTPLERAQIRKIIISLTLQHATESSVTLNFNTDIEIRNNA